MSVQLFARCEGERIAIETPQGVIWLEVSQLGHRCVVIGVDAPAGVVAIRGEDVESIPKSQVV